MLKLKEFYQYKRDLRKNNFALQKKLAFGLPTLRLPQTNRTVLSKNFRALLYVKVSKSNTAFTLTNLKGKVQIRQSCGSMGFQGKKKRSTKFAIEATLHSIAAKAQDLGHKEILVCLNGYGRIRFSILKCFKDYDLKLIGIRDLTPNPHNGCRPKKRRRV